MCVVLQTGHIHGLGGYPAARSDFSDTSDSSIIDSLISGSGWYAFMMFLGYLYVGVGSVNRIGMQSSYTSSPK